MDREKLTYIEKILNTDSFLLRLGKKDNGEPIIDRFEVDFTEKPEEEKKKHSKWVHIADHTLYVYMYLNSDESFLSCDDLWYDYNVDSAWWEANIIPVDILKYFGESDKLNERGYGIHVVVKSRDGQYTYDDCDSK